jgi:hypothetical protein
VQALAEELQAWLSASLPPTATPVQSGSSGFGGIEAVEVFPLETQAGQAPLWAAYSTGMRAFEPLQNHFVSIYTYGDGGWQELSRLELNSPDYFSDGSVQQVRIEPEAGRSDRIWLQAEGGTGAHAGCFDLLSFMDGKLEPVLSNCASSPLGGELRDLNGDGLQEALLNWSENYVFCYACNIRIPLYQVWRWNGSEMVEVQLSSLPKPAPGELSDLNDRAVQLAKGELWKDSQAAIHQAAQLDPDNETVAWNAALIDLHADARTKWAQVSSYPLLSHVFAGDYPNALDVLKGYSPEELFQVPNPLIIGTAAEGWEEALVDWMERFTGKALEIKPDLAAAYYLRAWARYLVDPTDKTVLQDIQYAAQLDPQETLYAESAHYLETHPR